MCELHNSIYFNEFSDCMKKKCISSFDLHIFSNKNRNRQEDRQNVYPRYMYIYPGSVGQLENHARIQKILSEGVQL